MGRRGSWEAQLGFLLSPSSAKTLLKTEKTKKEKERKGRVDKNLGMGIIFPDSQQSACSEKIEKAKIERFKFKLI